MDPFTCDTYTLVTKQAIMSFSLHSCVSRLHVSGTTKNYEISFASFVRPALTIPTSLEAVDGLYYKLYVLDLMTAGYRSVP